MLRALIVACLLLVPTVARADADADADARAVVAAWLAAQNDGDFKAYAASYDAKFVGIRRTSDGREKKMKLKAWKADRKKMFKRTQVVAADELKLEVTAAGVTARFLQRWKSGSYADHGTKLLRLAYTKAGAMKIAREELLSSTPGWDDDKSAVLDVTALVSPITIMLKGEGIDENDGCQNVTWVMYLKDAKKKVVQREIGQGDLMVDTSSGAQPSTIDADPAGATGTLYEVGEWCAGGADEYTVKHSGDALVVRYKSTGECTYDEPDCDPSTTETVLTIKLPEGAQVRAK